MEGTADPDYWWPPGNGYDFSSIRFAGPEVIPDLADCLVRRGYGEEDLRGILGGNFMRVADETWQPIDE